MGTGGRLSFFHSVLFTARTKCKHAKAVGRAEPVGKNETRKPLGLRGGEIYLLKYQVTGPKPFRSHVAQTCETNQRMTLNF